MKLTERANPGLHEHIIERAIAATPDRSATVLDIGCGSGALLVRLHIENAGAFLAEIRRVLAPTGRLLLTTPNVHSVEARLRLLLLGQLKQFDSIGDPTHLYPVFNFPFNRLLARHGLRVTQRWGYPQDGTSPTSRSALRSLASLARFMGLRGDPDGDQLCLVLQHAGEAGLDTARDKEAVLTAHY